MEGLLFLHFLFIFISPPREADIQIQRLVVQSSSTLTISGKTNVSKYRCATARHTGIDTLVLKAAEDKVVFESGLVRLAVSEFDCGMAAITKDFAKAIKADKFPFIGIEFISFKRMPRYESSEEKLKAELQISLAETTIPVEITCKLIKDENGLIHLTGSRNFTFSDFKLEPPSKVGGLVKAQENLTVGFHLVLVRL